MIERIEHGEVEGIRVGRFPSRINTTCIVYRIGSAVIDTGPPNQWRWVRRFIAERPVRRVVITHHHEDHSGNLAPMREVLDATLHAPAEGMAPLRDGFGLRLYQKLIWGRPGRVLPEALPDEIEIGPRRTLRPIPSPGHSVDMTCYLEPQRGWLFSGDLFISQRPRYMRRDENLAQQIESLRRVLALDFDTLFCSHRGVVRDGKRRLAAKLDFLESLRERARELDEQGRTVREITRALLGYEGGISWASAFHFSKRNLVRCCLERVP